MENGTIQYVQIHKILIHLFHDGPLRRQGVRYIVPHHSGQAYVLRMIPLPGRTREVSEVEPPELRLRNGLLLLITLGQPVKHDGVEVDIWIHNVIR
jgi:hypothetical protein